MGELKILSYRDFIMSIIVQRDKKSDDVMIKTQDYFEFSKIVREILINQLLMF